MNWTIEPLIGLGPLRIGMSAKEVARILNPIHPIDHRFVAFDGSIEEHRGLMVPTCSYDGDVLRGIDTTYRVENALFDGIDVYQSRSRDIMLIMSDRNGGAKYGLGILFFERLTVSTYGFFDGDKWFDVSKPQAEQRTVSVYGEKAFDPLMAQFQKIDLKKYK